MGIQDLNPFLNETMHRSRTREIPLRNFFGQPIAVDFYGLACSYFKVANKVVAGYTDVGSVDIDREAVLQKWYYLILDFVCILLSHGVTPVLVADGEHLPEKNKTKEKRRQSKVKDGKEIDNLKSELRNSSPFDRDPKKITRLRQLLSRCNYVTRDEIQHILDLFAGIGIPVLQAQHDGEQLCASMAKEGLVSAVYSEDTDNLVYGCPLLINSTGDSYYIEEENRSYRKATCVLLEDVLEELGWDQETFVDFCITLGCDFNERIKGLGPKTAHKLIQEHGSIDNYPKKYNLTSLNYERCREIFQHVPPFQVIEGDELPITTETLQIDKTLLFTQGEEILVEYSADNYSRRLKNLYGSLPEKAIGKLPTFPKRRIIRLKKHVQEDNISD